MFRITNPDNVKSLSVFGGKVFYIEPGSLEIDGEILRFRMNRSDLVAQIHRDELASLVEEVSK
ncbi:MULTISPECIES: hypothetical protein [Mycolicibacterium]|uniref:hypothetical protein n=1 Tax=Mycolicibacterium TaxID=1866885 RepID=UPI00055F9A1E|nr:MULTISPECIES: hypothetical protein [Mycolicibacterium]UJL26836.1 hypothetical protein HZU38_17925 [Mycolicibacterium vanbaalenii]WND58957.1 hypothetical protein QQA43_11530 [Mycolicibacterium vanbaalenii]